MWAERSWAERKLTGRGGSRGASGWIDDALGGLTTTTTTTTRRSGGGGAETLPFYRYALLFRPTLMMTRRNGIHQSITFLPACVISLTRVFCLPMSTNHDTTRQLRRRRLQRRELRVEGGGVASPAARLARPPPRRPPRPRAVLVLVRARAEHAADALERDVRRALRRLRRGFRCVSRFQSSTL